MRPHLDVAIQDTYLQSLPSPFPSLGEDELSQDWGKEYHIGVHLARNLYLYPAMIAFQRSKILLPQEENKRKVELHYFILSCYYFGKQYIDVINTFEHSLLDHLDTTLPFIHDIFIILFDSYLRCEEMEKAQWALQCFNALYPSESEQLALSGAIIQANIPYMQQLLCQVERAKKENEDQYSKQSEIKVATASLSADPFQIQHSQNFHKDSCHKAAEEIVAHFHKSSKKPILAGALNAIFPGLGYLYIGQKQSAFTAFCLNASFTAATIHFFQKGNLPGALIALSFECGWYFGGIVGAHEEAILLNERLFEKISHEKIFPHKLSPLLLLQYGF